MIYLHSFVYRKYIPLVSMDQRQGYKDDFNAEYDEYRLLHARVENITRRFTQLDAQCRKLAPGTKEHQVTVYSSWCYHVHMTVSYPNAKHCIILTVMAYSVISLNSQGSWLSTFVVSLSPCSGIPISLLINLFIADNTMLKTLLNCATLSNYTRNGEWCAFISVSVLKRYVHPKWQFRHDLLIDHDLFYFEFHRRCKKKSWKSTKRWNK